MGNASNLNNTSIIPTFPISSLSVRLYPTNPVFRFPKKHFFLNYRIVFYIVIFLRYCILKENSGDLIWKKSLKLND